MNATMRLLQHIKTYISPGDFYRIELPTMASPRSDDWVNGGLCPFHADRHPGSYYVNLKTGAFCCFSCDANGGDIVSFLQLRDGLSFRKALQKLADEWGV